MKTVFVIAGFDIHSTAEDQKYASLTAGLRKKGFNVVPVTISWRRKTPSQYAEEFLPFYEKHKSDYNIVIGNSFGAVVAFVSAPKTKPDELFLCSLSAFFTEDRGKQPDSYGIKYFGKRRMEDLWAISFDKIAKTVDGTRTKTVVIYGKKETESSPPLVNRCKIAAKRITNAELKTLPNSPHSMSDPTYSSKLLKIV